MCWRSREDLVTTSMTVGRFSFSPTAARWVWSDEMYQLHGMAPGDVVPTRALFLSHAHPDDRDRVQATLDACTPGSRPDSCTYRLVDLGGEVRTVTLAVACSGDDTGMVRGFVMDDSERHRQQVAAHVNAELQVALESHAVIDQAKGMLMLVYGIDDDEAFEVL